MYAFKRMPDGKEWTTENLNVHTGATYCYEDSELNRDRYGRLYTWDSATDGDYRRMTNGGNLRSTMVDSERSRTIAAKRRTRPADWRQLRLQCRIGWWPRFR
jgi:uncharacterized protein (TIGR02145 family)